MADDETRQQPKANTAQQQDALTFAVTCALGAVVEPPATTTNSSNNNSDKPNDVKDSGKKSPSPPPVVLDCGFLLSKVGFAGDDAPSCVFPTPAVILFRHRVPGIMIGMEERRPFDSDAKWMERLHDYRHQYCYQPNGFKNNALSRGVLIPKWQREHVVNIERGITTNWDDMEKIWHHSFYHELRVKPNTQPVILTERILSNNGTKAYRERITQIMFDTFNVPALYIASKEVLSLYASRQTSGCVIQSGDNMTQIVPIYEGYAIPHAIKKLNIAGGDIDDYLKKVFSERSRDGGPHIDNKTALNIKETLCYVALDFDEEMKKANDDESFVLVDKPFELPDGRTIVIGNERFRIPEILFQPSLTGLEEDGIADCCFQSIMKIDPDIRFYCFESIVLSGGSTMFPGIVERLKKELLMLIPDGMNVNIIAPKERKFSSWIGGSILASLEAMETEWITKEEYDDCGPSIVHRKCCI